MVLEGLEIDKKLRMLQPIYNMYVFEEDGDYYFREMY
jgi:hypothetical protein